MAGPTAPDTDVWLAPYLRLEHRIEVGGWEVIPADVLTPEDCMSPHAHEQCQGLIELYRRPRGVPDGFGCFLRERAPVGGSSRDLDLRTLHRALLVSVLDINVTPWRGTPSDLNWGSRLSTSDCLFIVWHRIDNHGTVSFRTGMLVGTLGALMIGDPLPGLPPSEITPPLEQPFPRARPPEAVYLSALFRTLGADDARSNRLAAAIDWLDLAWRNSPSVSETTRILIFKAAFEALLASGHTLPPQRAALGALLGRRAGRRRTRTLTSQRGNIQRIAMSDVEWWYTKFTHLRNDIAHGRPFPRRDLRHGRVSHFWLADHWLRAAIRCEAATATDQPELAEENLYDRLAQRWLREQRLQADDRKRRSRPTSP